MRTISLFAMSVLLMACTTTPMFPPEIMKDVKKDTSDFNAWKEQAYQPSNVHFAPHKVELGGQIIKVIRKPEGVVIIAEEQPIDKYLGYGPTRSRQEGSFEFAIVLNGFPDAEMLQVGNQLAVVGATDSARPETISWLPRVMPQLRAQCLRIWKTQGFETDNITYQGSMGYYPLEQSTFCQEEDQRENLSTGDGQGDRPRGS